MKILFKTSTLLTLIFINSSCENRFAEARAIRSFSFGFVGFDEIDCQRKHNPIFPNTYKNEVIPRKICSRYFTYKCHIDHHCNGDKQCEKEAANYWLSANSGGYPNVIEESCEREKKQCDTASKGDETCRK